MLRKKDTKLSHKSEKQKKSDTIILYFQIKFIQIYIYIYIQYINTHTQTFFFNVVYLSPIATYYYRYINFNSRLLFLDIFHFHISFFEAGLFDVCYQTDALPIFMQMQILCGS